MGGAGTCYAITGDPVFDAKGERVGVLAHLLLDGSGSVAYAVIGRGGVLGLGQTLHAVPWSAFCVDGESRRVVLSIERASLDKSPAFDSTQWPDFSDDSWQAVDRYYQKHA